ncbi:MAG: peroxiredoxin [Actinomycetota bacterium]|nr:peroxiredoxin [Actinomycetota bacterium]
MLREGDTAPEFTLDDQSGQPVTLSQELENGPVVVFFYPRALTRGCTAESCHFRDLRAEFEQVGARAIGISADSTDRQAEFDRRHSLGLPLLSDPDRAVARQFGVKRPGPLFNRRATFVIDTDRRILAAYSSELNMDLHADRALDTLRARAAST